jgi:hypothetical protein
VNIRGKGVVAKDYLKPLSCHLSLDLSFPSTNSKIFAENISIANPQPRISKKANSKMPNRYNGRFYPDLDISVAGRQATRYRTTYDIQKELEEAQAEANFCEDRSVNTYDHSIRDDESVNNDQSAGTFLESDAGSSVVNKTAPYTDLSHTKANGMLSIIENMTGAPYAGLCLERPDCRLRRLGLKSLSKSMPMSNLVLLFDTVIN